MIFSISSFNKALKVVLLVALFSGLPVWAQAITETIQIDAPVARLAERKVPTADELKVIRTSGQVEISSTEFYKVEVPSSVSFLPSSKPLVAGTTSVVWSADSGTDANFSYGFEIEKNGVIQPVISTGSESQYVWTPETAGRYRVRISATDGSGGQVVSPWSESLQVVSPLIVQPLLADHSSPLMAHSSPVIWSAEASGGTGELTFIFELAESGRLLNRVVTGKQSSWEWLPHTAGSYRARVEVIDEQGTRAFSQWSEVFRIEPRLLINEPKLLLENMTAAAATEIPLKASAVGGVGTVSYLLLVEKDGEMTPSLPLGNLDAITWTPAVSGSYRLGILATDALKNQAVSPWTESITIVPALKAFIEKQIETAPGQLVWTAAATGGFGPYRYEFYQRHEEGEETPIAGDGRSLLNWQPELLGNYQLKVVVTDASGHRAESLWSEPYQVAPLLNVTDPQSEVDGQQIEVNTSVRWSVESAGGFGQKTYRFMLQKNEEDPRLVQTSQSPFLDWSAVESGKFRVLVMVEDAMKHQLQSSWSAFVEVVTNRIQASPAAPRKALSGPVRWSFDYLGDGGAVDFTYELIKNNKVVLESVSSEPEWVWYPRLPGNYKVKVTAADGNGHVIASDLSEEYRITPAVERLDVFTVLPAENLSGVKAPLAFIRDAFSEALAENGLTLLGEADLQDFLRRNRVRYTGGVGSKTGKALKEMTGSAAVFILSVETYQESDPPKISLNGRLVLCRERPEIVWMDSVGLSGDEDPGFLGLGLVTDDRELIGKAIARLIDSLVVYLDKGTEAAGAIASGKQKSAAGKTNGHFLPKSHYRSLNLDLKRVQSVAVLPFTNRFARKNSGQVLPLHLIKQLLYQESLNVIEPGLIREALLQFRIVMEGGPSLSVADIMSSESVLDADLLIAGNVFDYQGLRGEPKVHFSVQAVETENREVVWWSNSYATGSEGVLLFDVGKIYTAHGLAERMARSLVSLLVGD